MTNPISYVSFKTYLRRMLRDPLGLLIFTVVPLFIVWVLSFVYSNSTEENIFVSRYNMVTTHLAIHMMILFQLNSGIYLLNYLHYDFAKSMKWRLRSTPCPTHTFIFSCIAACSIFNIAQGLLIVGFSAIFMDVYWGNPWVTLLIVMLISLFSQLLNILLFLFVKNLGLAETLSWFFSWIMAVLGGMMFSLPDTAFFTFMKTYGTPYSLAQTAIKSSGFIDPSISTVWICIAALVFIILLFAGLVIRLGRRKLA